MKKILEIIEGESVHLLYDDLRGIGNVQGLYVRHPRAGPMIVLDRSLLHDTRLHRCVAAHELGHHFNPPRLGIVAFHCNRQSFNHQNRVTMCQDECRALRWSTELLMPSEDVREAIRNGCHTIYSIADYFDVTEHFALARLRIMEIESEVHP